ncbi:hypothetical protein FB45DRAFT_872332 [Roridomyces roridus]|uniref:Uncharacterized protein n=1 Tax=Roridomyces roridus TaxID=1738132 RepID=A0AAD7BDB0_9AGAR|nr:hypothetical protein FB45DRAFT_872332 [Roridomyces roridus]
MVTRELAAIGNKRMVESSITIEASVGVITNRNDGAGRPCAWSVISEHGSTLESLLASFGIVSLMTGYPRYGYRIKATDQYYPSVPLEAEQSPPSVWCWVSPLGLEHIRHCFGWAIWTPEGIIYPAEHLDIADYADFLVGNDDIDQGRGVIRPGHVQVEEQFFELLMDSWKHRAMNKERSIKQSQYAKLNYAGLPDVGSVANKAALALKRKATGHLVGESSRAASAMTAAAASTSAAANAGSGSLALHFPAPPAANFAPAMPAFPAPAGANFAMGPPGMPTLNTAVHPMFAHRSNSAPSPSTTVMPSPAVSAMTSPLRGTTPPAFIGLDTTNLTAAELADLDLTNFSTSVPVMLGPFLASSSTTDDTATSVTPVTSACDHPCVENSPSSSSHKIRCEIHNGFHTGFSSSTLNAPNGHLGSVRSNLSVFAPATPPSWVRSRQTSR